MSTTDVQTKVIRARVVPEVKRRVVKLAKALRSDESEVVRSAVVQFLARHEKEAA